LFGGKIQALLQVEGKRSKRSVVGETLKNLGDVSDPERALETVLNFA
jgi:hypothetical protein